MVSFQKCQASSQIYGSKRVWCCRGAREYYLSYDTITEIWCFCVCYLTDSKTTYLSSWLETVQTNDLLWNGLKVWYVAVCVKHFRTLVTAHQLPTIHADCTPVLIGIILLRLSSMLSMFWKKLYYMRCEFPTVTKTVNCDLLGCDAMHTSGYPEDGDMLLQKLVITWKRIWHQNTEDYKQQILLLNTDIEKSWALSTPMLCDTWHRKSWTTLLPMLGDTWQAKTESHEPSLLLCWVTPGKLTQKVMNPLYSHVGWHLTNWHRKS
jgi:hypothetical protein